MKYTKEMLQQAVQESFCVSEVLRKLNIRGGGSHGYITKRIKSFEIDTSHFKRGSHLQECCPQKKPWQEILTINSTPRRTPALQLRRALVEMGRPFKCAEPNCLVENSWLGRSLVLDVDHINGNWQDNRPENLRFLCPNCHRQTENYGNRKRKTRQKLKTGQKISLGKRVPHLKARKVERPPLDIVRMQVEAEGYAATGRRYGVSDNAIRKWLKQR